MERNSGAVQPPRIRVTLGFCFALVIRIVCFSTGVHDILSWRPEIATPVTSFHRAQEGVFLQQSGVSPYHGEVFHQPPLALELLRPLLSASGAFRAIGFIVLDLAVAFLLRRLASRQRSSVDPDYVALLYLVNPFSVVTCVGMSTVLVNHVVLLLALASAQRGSLLGAVWFGAAVYLSAYPALLLPAIAVLSGKQFQFVFVASSTVAALLFLSARDGWSFVDPVYLFLLRVPDLTPNVGLFWYFFLEVFTDFRALFLCVFQIHMLVYPVPLMIRLRHRPLFQAFIGTGILSIFTPYPSVGCCSLFLGLLPLFHGDLRQVRGVFLFANIFLYTFLLAPVFWDMWLYTGTGNANFYYAVTLSYNLAQAMLLLECLLAVVRKDKLQRRLDREKKD